MTRIRRLGLGWRIALASALAVAVAASLAAVGVYYAAETSLRSEVEAGLERRAERIVAAPIGALAIASRPSGLRPGPRLPGGGPPGQVRGPGGDLLIDVEPEEELPLDDAAAGVLSGEREKAFSDATVDGQDVRVLSMALPAGGIVQIAEPIENVDQSLGALRDLVVAIIVAAALLAGVLAIALARRALGPVRDLRQASERVTQTGDLTERVPVQSEDDVGSLAGSFNAMLDALESSVAAQRQLVADASHELRTPITSIRTNAELLVASNGSMNSHDRAQALADISEQSAEMTSLIEELIELARAPKSREDRSPIEFGQLVGEVVRRAERRSRAVRIEARLEPTTVVGSHAQLTQAVANLVGNAIKWSPDGGTVDVELTGGVLSVSDLGPGIDQEDLPRVFDRFYRAPAARETPGSGLGLAIVRKVCDEHGIEIEVESAPGKGARFQLDLHPAQIDETSAV